MSVEQQTESHFVADNEQYDDTPRNEAASANAMRQVKEKPVSSAVIAVGVGIGAGLLLSTLFSSERSRRERLARSMGNFFTGGQGLRSSIENMLPDVITDRYRN